MVAHLLRLKLALLRNSLRRSVAALVGIIVGGLYASGAVAFAVAGLVALRLGPDADLARTVVTITGAALVAGWALLPLVLFGTDPTLDPARFATYAVPERSLAAGLVLIGVVGLPGAATVVLGLATVVTASRSVPAVLVGLVGAVLGVFTCVLVSRIVTSAAAAVLDSRRGRDLAGIGGLALFVGIGPLLGLTDGFTLTREGMAQVADVVAWTPLGWAWAAAGDVATGSPGTGLLRLLLAALLCLALFVAWERLLVSVLRNPRSASTSGSRTGRGLGLFGVLPGTPMGAVAARSGTYWLRDPRFNFPALMTVLLPAGLLFPGVAGDSRLALVAMPFVSAYLIGWGQHNDVGYDSTAFWTHVSAGVDGVADRLGRLFPSAVIAAVCVPVYAVLGPLVGGPWSLLPATLGVSVGVLLNGFAVACVTSAIKQYAVPAPGESPFSSRPGSVGVTFAVQTICGGAVLALSLPVLALGVLAWFGHAWATWTALVVGPVLGAAALTVGVRMGARLFHRRQADLLQDLVAMR